MATYKILKGSVFGTCQVNADGTMDDSQFISGRIDGYHNEDCGITATQTAIMYGAKPVCEMVCSDRGVDWNVKVYKVFGGFGLHIERDGWFGCYPWTLINTVGPMAIANAVTAGYEPELENFDFSGLDMR